MLLQVCLDVEADGELDRLACGAGRCDDDDATRLRLGLDEGLAIRRQVLIPYFAHDATSGLLLVLSEFPDHGEVLVVAFFAFVHEVITKDNLSVGRLVVDGGPAIRGRGLLAGRHLVKPYAAHAWRRPKAL